MSLSNDNTVVRQEAVAEPMKQRSSMTTLLAILVALAVVAAVVWLNRGTPDGVQPPPVAWRSISTIEGDIAKVKASKTMPEGQKGQIVGLLEKELEQTKAYQERTKAGNK